MPQDDRTARALPKEEPEFRELQKVRAQDRDHHIARGLEMGLSREEAERHADEHMAEREDEHE